MAGLSKAEIHIAILYSKAISCKRTIGPLLPIVDLVIMGNNDFIITVIIIGPFLLQ